MPRLHLPTDARSLADAVAEAVRDGVSRGELRPEETYSVYQLAELLGVSRSPVREAMLRLAEAGLVEIVRNRGFRVRRPEPHDIDEIIEIRQALEPAAARRVAEQADPETLDELRVTLSALADAARRDDEARFWVTDRLLHDRILRGAGNERAARIVATLRETAVLLGPPTTARGRTLAEVYAEHAPIIEAILRRDADGAARAMRDHLAVTGELLRRTAARGLDKLDHLTIQVVEQRAPASVRRDP